MEEEFPCFWEHLLVKLVLQTWLLKFAKARIDLSIIFIKLFKFISLLKSQLNCLKYTAVCNHQQRHLIFSRLEPATGHKLDSDTHSLDLQICLCLLCPAPASLWTKIVQTERPSGDRRAFGPSDCKLSKTSHFSVKQKKTQLLSFQSKYDPWWLWSITQLPPLFSKRSIKCNSVYRKWNFDFLVDFLSFPDHTILNPPPWPKIQDNRLIPFLSNTGLSLVPIAEAGAAIRRWILQVIDEDVWSPDSHRRNPDLVHSAVLIRVPDQVLVLPSLHVQREREYLQYCVKHECTNMPREGTIQRVGCGNLYWGAKRDSGLEGAEAVIALEGSAGRMGGRSQAACFAGRRNTKFIAMCKLLLCSTKCAQFSKAALAVIRETNELPKEMNFSANSTVGVKKTAGQIKTKDLIWTLVCELEKDMERQWQSLLKNRFKTRMNLRECLKGCFKERKLHAWVPPTHGSFNHPLSPSRGHINCSDQDLKDSSDSHGPKDGERAQSGPRWIQIRWFLRVLGSLLWWGLFALCRQKTFYYFFFCSFTWIVRSFELSGVELRGNHCMQEESLKQQRVTPMSWPGDLPICLGFFSIRWLHPQKFVNSVKKPATSDMLFGNTSGWFLATIGPSLSC